MTDWRAYARERLPKLGLRAEREAEIVEELAQQLDGAYSEARAAGLSEEAARTAAAAQIPDWAKLAEEIRLAEQPVTGRLPEPVRDSLHEQPVPGRRTTNLLADLWQDARYAARTFSKRPGFTLVALLTLALGIGGNAAIFTLVNAVLLRPLPYPESERLVIVNENNLEKGWTSFSVSPPNFVDWREQNQSFEKVVALYRRSFTYTGGDLPERLTAVRVTRGFFELLRMQPALGRGYAEEEFLEGKDHVVVLTHDAWQRLLNGRADALGQTLRLDGELYTVIGVMPAGFRFGGRNVALLYPFDAEQISRRRGAHYLTVMARLRPGRTIPEAQKEMDTIAARLREQYPDTNRGWGVAVVSFYENVVGNVRRALWVLLGAVGFVLLIACANVAHMLLSRATTRLREVAIRMALGASRARLVQQLLVESILLSLVGGAAGLLLARWGIAALLAANPTLLPRTAEIQVDATVFAFTLVLSLVTGAAFGLAPALLASKVSSWEGLKEGSPVGGSTGRKRLRGLLVVTEVSLALMLLIGSGLLLQSFVRLAAIQPGFATDNALTMTVILPRAKYQQPNQQAAFFTELRARLAALPGVESVTLTSMLPLSGEDELYSVEPEGRPPEADHPSALYYLVTPGYFRTMGISLLRGRDFNEQEHEQSTRVCIINDVLAERLYGGADAIGRKFRLGRNSNIVREVVGVVRSVKHYGLGERESFQVYEPMQQMPKEGMVVVMRSTANAAALAEPARRALRELDSEQPAMFVLTLEQVLRDSVAQPRFRTLLLGLFAGLALLLAAVGLYGVLAYSVAQRTREIGVRRALGARPVDVIGMVVREGMTLVAVGVAAGAAGAWALARVLEGLVFGISPRDAATFLGVSLLLLVVALLACWIPARRASRVDPMVALRYE
jgi:putative ABC transport system permease protein